MGEVLTIFYAGKQYASTANTDCGLAYTLADMNKISVNGTTSTIANEVVLGKLGSLTFNVTGEGSYNFSIIVMAAKGEY